MLLVSASALGQRNAAKGDRYFAQNLFEEALKYYEKETEVGSRESKNYAKKQIAECYRIIGEFEQAEKAYEKILKKKSNREDAANFLNYGRSLKSSAKFAEAKIQFEEFIKLRPDDPMGPIYLQSCDSAQAWLDETIGKDANLLESINSEATDFAPYLLPSNKLVFSSSREGSKEAFISFNGGFQINHLDFYTVDVHLLNGDSVGELGRISSLNSPLHEGPATFTADGTEIYFTRTVKGERNLKNELVNTLQVFYSKLDTAGVWTEPISAFSFNSLKYSIGHPSISKDGNTIYFMSDMHGGFGETDIYFSKKDENGEWGEPENMGGDVNTFGHELFPYVADNGTVYFSSDAHPGMGQLDVFSTTWWEGNSFEKGKWTNVQNQKPPVNSIGNDFGIVFLGKSKRGFFSSDRFNGNGAEDLYSFSDEAPFELTINNGAIQFSDLRVFDGIKFKLQDAANNDIPLLPIDGVYTLPLENNQEYTLIARKGFFTVNQVTFSSEKSSDGKAFTVNLNSSMHSCSIDGYLFNKPAVNDTINVIGPPIVDQKIKLDGENTSRETTTNERGYFNFGTPFEPGVTYSITTKK